VRDRVVYIVEFNRFGRIMFEQVNQLVGHVDTALAAFFPALVEADIYTVTFAFLEEHIDFSRCICSEFVDSNQDGQTKAAHVLNLFGKVREPVADSLDIFLGQFRLLDAAMHLEGADRSNNDNRIRIHVAIMAFDVEEFFSAKISTEASFRNGNIAQFKGHFGSKKGVASVGNVRKRTAMDDSRRMFQRLDEVRFDGIFHEHGHGPFTAQLMDIDRIPIKVRANDDTAKTFLQVFNIMGQAKDGHDFGSNSNHEPVFAHKTAGFTAQADNNMTESTVVHIHDAAPGNLTGIDPQFIALMDMVVNHCGQQVVGSRNGVHIPREMQIDVIHRNNLRIAAASSTALDSKHRPQGRFAECYDGFFANLIKGLDKANARRGFTFPSRGRRDGRYKDQFPVGFLFQAFQYIKGNLCFIVTILFQFFRMDIQFFSNLANWLHNIFLCNLDIAKHGSSPFLGMGRLFFCVKQALFKNFVHIEVFDLEIVLSCHEQALHGDRPNDFRTSYGNTITAGFHLDHFESAVNSGLFIVDKVHGDLGHVAVFQFQANGLDIVKAAADVADFLGNSLSDFNIRRMQVDVECNEGNAGTNSGATAYSIHFAGAIVRFPFRFLDLIKEAFVLTFADRSQVAAPLTCCGIFIKIDRNAHFTISLTDFVGDFDTFIHRYTHNRRKGYNINSTKTRMGPMMFAHINQTNGYLCHIDGSFRYRFRRPDDGDNRTIVVRVAGIVQDLQP